MLRMRMRASVRIALTYQHSWSYLADTKTTNDVSDMTIKNESITPGSHSPSHANLPLHNDNASFFITSVETVFRPFRSFVRVVGGRWAST